MKTKEDVINALRRVHFLERTAELSQKVKRDNALPVKTARKDKVISIIEKLGYNARFRSDKFIIDGVADDEQDRITFWFDRPWIKIAYYYFDEGEQIIGFGPWSRIKKDVAASDDYRSGSPAYSSYEDIEEIISEAIEIYKESLKALYDESSENTPAPIPDFANLYHLTTTKKEVCDALIKMKFVEKETKLKEGFRKKADLIMPPIDRKKVFAIVEKLGFVPGHMQDFYYIKNQEVGPYSFTMNFTLKYAIVDIIWYVSEAGDVIHGGSWEWLEKELEGTERPRPGLPKFPNYDALERILAYALQMFEDFKYAFCSLKGIEYERKRVLALEKQFLETEERDTKPLR